MLTNSILDLLQPGESAIAVFTKGWRLTIGSDGSGTSGNWKMNASDSFDKVIIYLRPVDTPSAPADIYLADFSASTLSDEGNRRVIRFHAAKLVGSTTANWSHFALTGANPVRYLHK